MRVIAAPLFRKHECWYVVNCENKTATCSWRHATATYFQSCLLRLLSLSRGLLICHEATCHTHSGAGHMICQPDVSASHLPEQLHLIKTRATGTMFDWIQMRATAASFMGQWHYSQAFDQRSRLTSPGMVLHEQLPSQKLVSATC